MKIRNTGGEPDKIEPQMAPMIDVVFQLLIFFMLTLKIVEPEGDFTINMPKGKPQQTSTKKPPITPKDVTLNCDAEGRLTLLTFGGTQCYPIGVDVTDKMVSDYRKLNEKEGLSVDEARRWIVEDAGFRKLNESVENWVRTQRRFHDEKKLDEHMKIKIQFAYNLNNRYIIKVTSACRGKLVPGQENPQKLVKNIEFMKPAIRP